MTPLSRGNRDPGRLGAVCLALACAFSVGCAPGGAVAVEPMAVAEFPHEHVARPGTAQSIRLAGPVAVGVARGVATLMAVRSTLRTGAYELVTTVNGAEFSRRRIERIGENLTILPLPSSDAATIEVSQAANAGPLDVVFLGAETVSVNPRDAQSAASGMATRFEAETGQLADPLVENLVPNASFAADDEVRGTPADWFAYVETSADVVERRLRVSGIAPGQRPFLATGPIRVEPGRRYRVLVRLEVRQGSVALRIVDYEELRVISDLGSVAAGDGRVERRIDFEASESDRAARIRFEPSYRGESVDFELSAIQMELLPLAQSQSPKR